MRVFLLVALLLFLSSSVVSADVVINEVMPNPEGDEANEFIELYNTSGSDVDLEGYVLIDQKGQSFTISGKQIAASSYLVFYKSETSIPLNNDEYESVTLKNSSDVQIDTMSFGSTIEGKSWSRIENGTGGFINGADPTPGSENVAPPVPTATPTPESTPTPTPIPTFTPTPSPEPTPTKKVANESSNAKDDSKTQKSLPSQRKQAKPEFDILGSSTKSDDITVDEMRQSLSESGQGMDERYEPPKVPYFAILFVVAGICFVGAGFYVVKIQKKDYTGEDEK